MGIFTRYLAHEKKFENIDGNRPDRDKKQLKTVKKDTTTTLSPRAQSISSNFYPCKPQKFENLEATHKKTSKKSWMDMPIICGGVQCKLAYLQNHGGLVCGVNHTQILMMESCPKGLWDRGYKVFEK